MASKWGRVYGDPDDYKTLFDTDEYLKIDFVLYYGQIMTLWHGAADASSLRNKRLLDVGTGPSLLSVLSFSRLCDSITLSDFLPSNRDQLRKWIGRERGAHDWTEVFQEVAKLEGKGTTAADIETRLRDTIEPDVLSCDIHKENPVDPATPEPFDIISTQLCLESACRSQDEYQQALCNVSSLLKPGGVFYQMGALEATYYPVGDLRFRNVYLTVESIENTLRNSGFKNIKIQTLMYEEGEIPIDISDVKGVFLAQAFKAA